MVNNGRSLTEPLVNFRNLPNIFISMILLDGRECNFLAALSATVDVENSSVIISLSSARMQAQ